MLRRETRQAWGAVPPRNRRYDVTPQGVAIHYPGSPGTMRDLTHDQHQALLRGWQTYHMGRGSNDIEYGSIICPCGIWMEGRTEFDNWFVRVGSNGTRAANTTHTSVQLLIGNADRITDQEKAWLAEAVATLREHGWGPQVTGHRDHYATACPGDSIYTALPDIRRMADQWEDPMTPEDMAKLADLTADRVWDKIVGRDLADKPRPASWLLTSAQRMAARAARNTHPDPDQEDAQ